MDTTLQETNFGANFELDILLGIVARTHNRTYPKVGRLWVILTFVLIMKFGAKLKVKSFKSPTFG